MGNPTPPDLRFDKPTLESLVDLINFSNKSYIKYGEIEADQVTPDVESESELLNTTVRIRLAGAGEGAPYSTMTYGRLDLSQYLSAPGKFVYNETTSTAELFEQLRQLHHVWLSEEVTTIIIGEINVDGFRPIAFIPNLDHMVWMGQLVIMIDENVVLV